MLPCRCHSIDEKDGIKSFAEFEAIRSACPALKEVLIPDRTWEYYKKSCNESLDEACHQPTAYWAYCNRCLSNLTRPVHLFCLDGSQVNASVTSQYRKDMVERWMLKESYLERYSAAKSYQGRLYELLFAEWIKCNGWRIDGLEIWGAPVDVLATSPQGKRHSIEIKYIGPEKVSFDLGVSAIQSGGVASGALPVYSPVDYMLYRVYEAACQLKGKGGAKVVTVILSDYGLYFERPLVENWIDWQSPKFIRRDHDIDEFLDQKYQENGDLDDDLKKAIAELDELWFFSCGSSFSIQKTHAKKFDI